MLCLRVPQEFASCVSRKTTWTAHGRDVSHKHDRFESLAWKLLPARGMIESSPNMIFCIGKRLVQQTLI